MSKILIVLSVRTSSLLFQSGQKRRKFVIQKMEIVRFDYHPSGEENTLVYCLKSEDITCISERACELVYLQSDEGSRALVI